MPNYFLEPVYLLNLQFSHFYIVFIYRLHFVNKLSTTNVIKMPNILVDCFKQLVLRNCMYCLLLQQLLLMTSS